MRQRHIAFLLEQAYGHIIPTLGIALELIRRGHRVSYAVTHDFARPIRSIGAQAVVFKPLVTRPKLLPQVYHDRNVVEKLRREKTEDSLAQLEVLFHDDRPDLVIQDDCEDFAGRSLASKWGIPQIRFFPAAIQPEWEDSFANDQLVLISVPRFFQSHPERFAKRYKFIGFIPEGRKQFFEPWKVIDQDRKTILVSVTTGYLPQIEFCKLAVSAFRDQCWNIVLSIGGTLDRVSEIAPTSLADLPQNIQLNRFSSNFEILEHACLFVGQGGQGSTLEALYCGVPALLSSVESSPDEMIVVDRVVELGLGAKLATTELSAESLRNAAASLLRDGDTLSRVREVQKSMREERGAVVAANLIEEYA